MKSILRKIVHLCGGLMPDEIVSASPMKITPIKRARVSFEHEPNVPSEYIDKRAAQLLGEYIINNHLAKSEIDVDWSSKMITRHYDFYVIDLHSNT